jgi:hypothetical protein
MPRYEICGFLFKILDLKFSVWPSRCVFLRKPMKRALCSALEFSATYLVVLLWSAVALPAQEPSPSSTASRIPWRPHHSDSEMPEDAQPQNVPELLPRSNILPGTGARLPDSTLDRAIPTPTPLTPEQIKQNQARFEAARSSAIRSARALFLLEQSRIALTEEARNNYLRAYYYSVCAEMRRREPGLKSMINEFEREQIRGLAKGRSPLVSARRTKPVREGRGK